MEKMKCEPRRLKGKGEGESTRRLKARGEEERHALAKPRLVAVLRSKLRFTRFLQVPTGSHCLSSSPLAFRLLVFLLSLSLYFPQVPKSSHCLSSSPLAFRMICRLLLFLLSIISVLPQSTSGLHWLSLISSI